MTRVLKPLMLVLAVLLLGWYLSKIEWQELLRALARIGAFAPLILLPYFVVYLVDAWAWAQTLPQGIGFWTVFRIRWAGESINNTIPSAHIGGEAVKVWLLRSKGLSASTGAMSVVVSKTAQTIAQMLFILAASAVFLVLAHDQSGLRTGLVVVLCGSLAAVAALCWVQKAGAYRVALVFSRVLPPVGHWLEHKKEKLLEFDATVLQFYRHERPQFYRSTALFLCGWMLDTLEIYLVAHLLGLPISWPHALVIEAFAGVAKIAGMWVPGSLGIQESGIVVLARWVGAPGGLGIPYALIRRVRDLIFAAIGWFFLLREGNVRTIRSEIANATQARTMASKALK